ncbi:MAG: DUF502 domain-containing protein [Prolixibacteraceae bacterium]|nr:DUF502 domain-containing protein [Prolixibacteraceae bacterium]
MKTVIKFNHFARTALIGGLAAILPAWLLFIIFSWIVRMIENYLEPLVRQFDIETIAGNILIHVILVSAIILIFFFIGLFVQTGFGNRVRNHLERRYLLKIPGYKTASEVVKQFFGGNRSFFSEVVLIDIYNSGALMTGFITDPQEKGHFITVFVPTGPNPTSGNIFHLPRERVYKSTIPVDVAIKTIISCGAGSTEVFNNTEMNPDDIKSKGPEA